MSATAADTNPVTDNNKNPHYFLRPRQAAPRVYLEGALGAATFFDRVTVLVNGIELRQEQLGEHGYLYQQLNRTLMSKENRLLKYGRDFPRISVRSDGKITTDKAEGLLAESMESLEFDTATLSADKILRFNMDG